MEPEDEERRSMPGRREVDRQTVDFAALAGDFRAMTKAIDALNQTIATMATKEEVAAAEARQDRKRRLAIAGIGAVIFILVGLVGSDIQVLNQVKESTAQNKASADLLVECLTPGNPSSLLGADRVHECYDRNQARDLAIQSGVALTVLDAAQCVVTVKPPDIPKCYADRIQARTGVRPPTS